ncbi:MAG: 23S rRNA (pseudouridine(1915)-N(3))-methyltransferase RlmH, partial [Desulfovibrionaceae bacterium]|nr:23S rRNA (pseudouridine(1915)-N(3))-methyltransferase RlmH [Desulfovibrionaceae bacterium]
MEGKPLRLVCVGKLKQNFIKEGCALYQERLKPWRKLELIEVRDVNLNISLEERQKREALNLSPYLKNQDLLWVLDEKGTLLTSKELAQLLAKAEHLPPKNITLVIGGPYGLAKEVLAKAKQKISLSPLTFTHEMARLILYEQLYRAH